MNRCAIIIESSNLSGEHFLPGAKTDQSNWISFLKSDLGGAWVNEEIVPMHQPALADVRAIMSSHADNCYTLVVFSGHGCEMSIAYAGSSPCVSLNDSESAVPIRYLTPRLCGTAIFDCCRGEFMAPSIAEDHALTNESSSLVKNSSENFYGYQNRIMCRNVFDCQINAKRCSSPVVMLACAKGESASEDPSAGGFYTSLLMRGAKRWASNNSSDRVYSTFDAHHFAVRGMLSLAPQQHPQYSPANESYPFAVRA